MHGQKHELIDNQNIIFIIFEEPRNIDPVGECKIGKEVYYYSSHVCEKSEYIGYFSYNEFILHEENETLLISDRENFSKNVKMVVLIKEITKMQPSSILPYDKQDFYEVSKKGKETRKSYDQSEKGKKRKHISEQHQHVKETRKSYEQSQHGKETRTSYEESE